MKNNKLLLSSALLSGAILALSSFFIHDSLSNKQGTNQKPENEEHEQGAAGAAQWLFNIQKNPITGKIDPNDILSAREESSQMRLSRSTNGTLGLDWQELGPDNVGGRTRSILIDKNNTNRIFAGSVSG